MKNTQSISINLIYQDVNRSMQVLIDQINQANNTLLLLFILETFLILFLKETLGFITLIPLLYTLLGLYPFSSKTILDPVDQLEDESLSSVELFQEKVIRLMAQVCIPSLENNLASKQDSLRISLVFITMVLIASLFTGVQR